MGILLHALQAISLPVDTCVSGLTIASDHWLFSIMLHVLKDPVLHVLQEI